MTDSEVFSHEAEALVLATILQNPQSVYNLNGLRPFMMDSSINATLLDTMITLGESNLQADRYMVENKLKSMGKIDTIGGTEILDFLSKKPIQGQENFDEYIEQIKDSYKTRYFLTKINAISLDTVRKSTISEVLSDFQLDIDKLIANSGGGYTSQVGTLVNDVFSAIEERAKNPGMRGITTGTRAIDVISGGYIEGDLWVVSGRPSQGKTAVLCNSALNIAKSGKGSVIFSKEMNSNSLVERLLSIETGVSLTNIRLGNLSKAELRQIDEGKELFREFKIFLDANFGADIHYIESTVRKYVQLHDIKVVFIDYLQLLSERDRDATQELGRITKKLKLLAEKLQICIVLLSQLNREVEHRDNKRPILSDMRQSGNIEEDADVVVGLYRDEYYNKDTRNAGVMEFIFLKQRNGPIGTVPLKFNPNCITIKGE